MNITLGIRFITEYGQVKPCLLPPAAETKCDNMNGNQSIRCTQILVAFCYPWRHARAACLHFISSPLSLPCTGPSSLTSRLPLHLHTVAFGSVQQTLSNCLNMHLFRSGSWSCVQHIVKCFKCAKLSVLIQYTCISILYSYLAHHKTNTEQINIFLEPLINSLHWQFIKFANLFNDFQFIKLFIVF